MSTYREFFESSVRLGIDPVGSVIASIKSIYQLPAESQNEMKLELIKQSFQYHYMHNALYNKICKEKGVALTDFQCIEDVASIPAIGIGKFKDVNAHLLLTKPIHELEHELRSTGTSGIPSISRRDEQTLTRSVLSIFSMFREMFGFFGGAAVYLAPSAEEMPEMGLVKLINMFSGLLDSNRFFISGHAFDAEAVIHQLKDWQHVHTRHIIGPPFLVERLAAYIEEHQMHIHLDKQTQIITLGGWRSFTGREIDQSKFRERMARIFGVHQGQVRDMFGLVETNFMAIECEHHAKHVPPWVHFSIRNLDKLEQEVTHGEPGRLVVYDPTSLSYPGFILTDDLVYLDPNPCSCGRNGQVVNYMYRIKGAEVGCCAINLEKFMSDREARITQCPIG
ncbi:LuxE family acyl-protein synthetase [Paenibacillus sp. CGMCC 1.16610]|uniref:LuxE family acyl-protein synthetase n=1 Tax=Paenibacillus anseongense TaxID=2682845 RepID=A0ABW9UES2_9BACL|nr:MULTISPECIES: LuxE family acyl-protein synthetase [Paenibacillus]MBA2943886.1 LuxE family acyl-protein synthetase [Paenibacillus sp. CGMCC 1.16610]MVQ37775.1 LuxE family acyl-protein synthetase [Paenibacillus anseongense]